MTSEVWAVQAVKVLGAKKAYSLCLATGREHIGEDSSNPNPFHKFYKQAADLIKKKHPDVLKPD